MWKKLITSKFFTNAILSGVDKKDPIIVMWIFNLLEYACKHFIPTAIDDLALAFVKAVILGRTEEILPRFLELSRGILGMFANRLSNRKLQEALLAIQVALDSTPDEEETPAVGYTSKK